VQFSCAVCEDMRHGRASQPVREAELDEDVARYVDWIAELLANGVAVGHLCGADGGVGVSTILERLRCKRRWAELTLDDVEASASRLTSSGRLQLCGKEAASNECT
jgi:hypothetical protein